MCLENQFYNVVDDKETDISVSSSMDVGSSTAGWASGSGDGVGNGGGGGAGEDGTTSKESSVWGEEESTEAKDKEAIKEDKENNTK